MPIQVNIETVTITEKFGLDDPIEARGTEVWDSNGRGRPGT